MWQIFRSRPGVKGTQRLAMALLVLTLLLAAWGVIDPIGPDWNWGPMWR